MTKNNYSTKPAFSLMEMMIVLLIVAIIAAASAPMIAKKMMRQTGTGDSPWVFTGTGNSVAFNMRGNRNDTVLIGTGSIGVGAQNAPLYIRTPENAAGIPDGNAISFAMGNEVVGHLGITHDTTYMSNIIPMELGGSNDGAVIIGHLNTDRQAERAAGSNNADDTIANKTVIGYLNKLWLNDQNHTSQDTIIGSSIGLRIADNNPSTVIGTNINAGVAGTGIPNNPIAVANSAIIGQNIQAAANTALTNCTLIGDNMTPQGDLRGAVAVGSQADVRANNTIAVGWRASAQNTDAIAIGNSAHGIGQQSVAIGGNSNATGNQSIAIGGGTGGANASTQATAINTIAIGSSAQANRQNAIAIGRNAQAQHNNSVAIGVDAQTAGNNQIMLGSDGLNGRAAAPTVVIPGNLRVEGNIIYNKNGNHTFDDVQSGYIIDSTVTSDIRLKNVGEKLTSGLEDIKKLEFFNYTFKDDKEQKPHVGVMAQDLQKVFPISVSEGSDGYLRIRWDEMFYAALNAIKELDNKITEIKTKVTSYFDRVAKLEAQIDEQQKTIEELQKQNAEFKKRLAKIEKRGVGVKGVNNKIKTPALKSESEAE